MEINTSFGNLLHFLHHRKFRCDITNLIEKRKVHHEKSGAEIIVESLLEQGVDTVFGYPGGQVIDLYDALYAYQDRLKHVLCSHEQHACHAADGYFRATGKVGTVIATSGPGATNW